ncbi:hypothetical protein AVEN_208953-1 [Araneus ventricosus]|uniref:Uncharacterized protein n=1 Tax=Araneus ventricosus TaxID=182803 RepID=A0A4Y2GAY1_ARAVE|nr:hypothetical protein AVEN_208953-1 [Araneus ventricosus]
MLRKMMDEIGAENYLPLDIKYFPEHILENRERIINKTAEEKEKSMLELKKLLQEMSPVMKSDVQTSKCQLNALGEGRDASSGARNGTQIQYNKQICKLSIYVFLLVALSIITT